VVYFLGGFRPPVTGGAGDDYEAEIFQPRFKNPLNHAATAAAVLGQPLEGIRFFFALAAVERVLEEVEDLGICFHFN